ncbi:benzoate-CoA ligase family protein [Zavarzinia sp. CC-PAN008]|uniref:benzoate-CoA ligase family protein n=1 Tax=Zavarzinia sp. CC-PAN008 TaxID=3243332 RepID=UPI003F749357
MQPARSVADPIEAPTPANSGAGLYNAADDLLGRNLKAGRADKVAIVDAGGSHTYGALAAAVERCAGGLLGLGLEPEQRVVLAMLDSVEFPVAFLGAIRAGLVPVPLNTLLTPDDYVYMVQDSRARALVVSAALLPVLGPAIAASPWLRHVIVAGAGPEAGHTTLDAVVAGAAPLRTPCPTRADDPCLWLYSSGSTGAPKGTVHVQSSLAATADTFGAQVLGLTQDDVVFSAAKLFFAYGLGNSLTFPFAVGATAVLLAERPTPEAVVRMLTAHRPTIFCGVPTLYAGLLASGLLPPRGGLNLRLCTSAGEALPPDVGHRWTAATGTEILDGIGSTEMLHIFIANRPGQVRYGTSGKPVPGYEARLLDDAGGPVAEGEIGELQVRGPSAAAFYWCQREKSRATFLGPWTRTGDKYLRDPDGYYVFCGRSDDMLKVGGIFVSPFEVEAALSASPDVLEAAVIGREDPDGLVKPMAFVVPRPGIAPDEALEARLKAFVKERLAPYKYPRWIEFLDELPKTATGKIQRFKLRG